jgi:hypothetical protein
MALHQRKHLRAVRALAAVKPWSLVMKKNIDVDRNRGNFERISWAVSNEGNLVINEGGRKREEKWLHSSRQNSPMDKWKQGMGLKA